MMKKTNFNKDFLKTSHKDLSLYIHIPFCEKKCSYCDFNSVVASNNIIEKYFFYLEKEILLYKDFLKDKNIISIFIGGGTPSSVNPLFIKKILKIIKSISSFSKNIEITIECNPNSLKEKNLSTYLDSNINRFSVGAQSLNESILKSIGRIHNKKDIINAVILLKNYNVENFNLDFMLSLPNQNFRDIEDSIDFIKNYDIPHISYYSLILEENTPLYNEYLKFPAHFDNEIEDRNMYHFIVDSLNNLGLTQYEISNFSKEGFDCIHNLRYWHLKNYLAFGLSAHSNIDNFRFYNYQDFDKYFNFIDNLNYPICDIENLTTCDRINEYFILSIRLNEGIDLDEANNIFKINFLNYYKNEINNNIKKGLISLKNNKITLTNLGRDLSNKVEIDFIRL